MAESVINSGTKGGRVMSVSEFQVVDEYFNCFNSSNCLVNSYRNTISEWATLYRSRAGRLFMEQIMRFGLVFGWLAIMKKNWGPIMGNF